MRIERRNPQQVRPRVFRVVMFPDFRLCLRPVHVNCRGPTNPRHETHITDFLSTEPPTFRGVDSQHTWPSGIQPAAFSIALVSDRGAQHNPGTVPDCDRKRAWTFKKTQRKEQTGKSTRTKQRSRTSKEIQRGTVNLTTPQAHDNSAELTCR